MIGRRTLLVALLWGVLVVAARGFDECTCLASHYDDQNSSEYGTDFSDVCVQSVVLIVLYERPGECETIEVSDPCDEDNPCEWDVELIITFENPTPIGCHVAVIWGGAFTPQWTDHYSQNPPCLAKEGTLKSSCDTEPFLDVYISQATPLVADGNKAMYAQFFCGQCEAKEE